MAPDEIRTLERLAVDWIRAARGEQGATGRIAPRADQCGQARGRADRHSTAGVALHAVIQADNRRLDRAVVARERDDVLDSQSRDLRDAPRRIFAHARLERFEAERVTRDVVVIEQVLCDEDVHHSECECSIGTGQEREMPVTLLRGETAVGIDRDQRGSAPLGFLDAAP